MRARELTGRDTSTGTGVKLHYEVFGDAEPTLVVDHIEAHA